MKYRWQSLDAYGYRLYRVKCIFYDGTTKPYLIDFLVWARNWDIAKKMVKKINPQDSIQIHNARAERVLMRDDYYDMEHLCVACNERRGGVVKKIK